MDSKHVGVLLLAIVTACDRNHDEPRAAAPAPAPAQIAPPVSVPRLVAGVVCDHYWRSTSANARPYDSMDQCIVAETRERPCDAATAQTCAERARAIRPGDGVGLHGIPECAACLSGPDPELQRAWAEQKAALNAASLVILSARVHQGRWPKEVERPKDGSLLVRIDLSLTGYGYRIDPDDFVLVTTDATPTTVGSWPYAERLTRTGAPVDWTDPSVIDDPDLRMLMYFTVPTSARGTKLVISYDTKTSAPFEIP